MNELFRNTLSPVQWAVLAAAPPAILALYFLKLRRAPLQAPSTYLWRKTIEDLRVNSLWQRLRRSLLLLLQLLAVGLAILALLRPGWQGTELTGGRLVFLVDNSASMSTTDAGEGDAGDEASEGGTRLALAKEKVAGLIDQMERGMTAMIVSFADRATVVQQFTDNPRLLRERLATIGPTAGTTDLAGALDLVAGLANPGQAPRRGGPGSEGQPDPDQAAAESGGATVFILSDGRFGEVEDFALGELEPVYVPLGSEATRNLAITALETRQSEADAAALVAFVQAANFGAEAASVVVEVKRGERLIDARRLALPAGGSAGLTMPIGDAIGPPDEGTLVARLTRDSLAAADDRLAVDDVAYAAVNPPESRGVLLVTSGNVAVEQALATGRAGRLAELTVQPPSFLQSRDYATRAAAGTYRLAIYDRCAPEESPRASAVYVGTLPPGDTWRGKREGGEENGAKPTSGGTVSVPQVIDWNRTHPLLANVELGNFDVVESLLLTPPSGSVKLVDAAEGTLVAIAKRDTYEDVVIGFPILVEVDGALQRNTDWINRHSFPTFWLNVLEHFVARQGVGERSLQPGESVELRPGSAASETLVVTSPSGRAETLRRRGEQPFVYRQTGEAGVYRVEEQGREPRGFAVNLFDPDESDVRLRTAETPDDKKQALVASIKIGNVDVAATAGGAPARKEIWKLLLVGMLAILVAEWYVYHRRVYL